MEPGAVETSGAPRLADFEREAARMGVRAGRAEPERWLVVAGIVLVAAGAGLAGGAWVASNGTNNVLDQNDAIIMAITGVVAALVGVMLWARYSLSRYFRYWLTRLIYEDRQQADRIVEALGRVEQRLVALHEAAAPSARPTTESNAPTTPSGV